MEEIIKSEAYPKIILDEGFLLSEHCWRRTLKKIKQETGLGAESLTKIYVEKALHQT